MAIKYVCAKCEWMGDNKARLYIDDRDGVTPACPMCYCREFTEIEVQKTDETNFDVAWHEREWLRDRMSRIEGLVLEWSDEACTAEDAMAEIARLVEEKWVRGQERMRGNRT